MLRLKSTGKYFYLELIRFIQQPSSVLTNFHFICVNFIHKTFLIF